MCDEVRGVEEGRGKKGLLAGWLAELRRVCLSVSLEGVRGVACEVAAYVGPRLSGPGSGPRAYKPEISSALKMARLHSASGSH